MNDILVFDPVLSTFQYNDIADLLTQLTLNMLTHSPRWGEIHLTRMTTRSTRDLTRIFDEPDENIYISNYHNNLLEDLTLGISLDTRIEIISRWLKGEQRDRISADSGLGAGTVSSIVSEWKAQIGIPEANALRQFSTELRRAGITASQCALEHKGY